MAAEKRIDIDEVFRRGAAIDAALRKAGLEALRLHALHGVRVPSWENGAIVFLDARKIARERLGLHITERKKAAARRAPAKRRKRA